jgi:hypothetical protein
VQVTITNVNVEWGGKPPKKWGKAVVEYTYNGQARKQNVMSFSNPEVFKKVQELVGQTVDVEVGKNDKDFTEWRSINSVGSASTQGTSTQSTSATRVSGSNYETKEERAARQVLIVKQSSLSAAVATLNTGAKSAPPAEAVLALAQQYADWVFETAPDESGFDTMSNDIPF